MCCYNTKNAVPVYKAQIESLRAILGKKTDKVVKHLNKSKLDILIDIDDKIFYKLQDKETYLKKQIYIKR